jgi:hypothetical protein
LNVTQPGPFRLRFNSTDGVTLWVGTKPQKVAAVDGAAATHPSGVATETTLNLSRGTHRVTVGIDLKVRKTPLQVELDDAPGSPARVSLVTGK